MNLTLRPRGGVRVTVEPITLEVDGRREGSLGYAVEQTASSWRLR